MFASLLFYASAAGAAIGALSLVFPLRFLGITTRSIGAGVLGAGLVLAAAVLALPVSENRVRRRTMLLDDAMPVWQFGERHALTIHASPQRIFDAIHKVTADEIFLFRTLTAIRRLGRPLPESILNAPKREPLLDLATRTSFVLLADDPYREVVVGSAVGGSRTTMNFLIESRGPDRAVVTTETRVYADTPAAARRFAVYWRMIHPGSDIIRRGWLHAIRRRAENPLV